MKRGLIKEILTAVGIGIAAGITVAAITIALILLCGGKIEYALVYSRSVTAVAVGFGLVYSGLVMFTTDGSRRSAHIFQFRLGKTKRTLGDELQPKDDDRKKIFVNISQKYVGLYVSLGILISYVLMETLRFPA